MIVGGALRADVVGDGWEAGVGESGGDAMGASPGVKDDRAGGEIQLA